ncbi:hypothetical protein HID58_075469 [Brassica napus]|uniref:Uncharacterized protein n=1 Tax=Brassica napus TaxID=3708 RepID=A0ABQ7YK04_BRANA|nr:hypothetical protein HID58_075469 [Brassica napus]
MYVELNKVNEQRRSGSCWFMVEASSGSIDTNNVTIFAHYSKPLFHFFESLKPTEKMPTFFLSINYNITYIIQVILVGHDFGGACIMFPTKISKAVFISAAKLANGQSTLDLFNQKIFLYANGKKNPPTAADFDRSLLKKFIFNLSPPKDIALASVSIRPIPFAPVGEKLHV